jgi:hypothetical protein
MAKQRDSLRDEYLNYLEMPEDKRDEGYGRSLADRAMVRFAGDTFKLSQWVKEGERERAAERGEIEELSPQERFLREVERCGGFNVNDVFAHRDSKEKLLRLLGYNVLYGPKRVPIKLENCSDAKIGNAFKKAYGQAKRKYRGGRLK